MGISIGLLASFSIVAATWLLGLVGMACITVNPATVHGMFPPHQSYTI
jgi:hypothetical protein